MDRRNEPTLQLRVSRWQRSASAAVAALSTTDGRWALVSTSLTALIAGTIAWLALATVPPSSQQMASISQDRTLIPYQLFQQLTRTGDASYAAFAPGRTIDARHHVATGVPQGSLDNSLAAEESGDNSNPTAGIETRTIALDSGDTLAGALTDAGVTQDDAQAVVNALAKVYELRSLRAGQNFELTFQASPQASTANAPTISNIDLAGDGADQDTNDNGAFVPEQASPAGKLLSVSFSPSVEHDVTITRTTDGTFAANDVVKKLESHVHRAGATIDSSLYLAAMQAGIPADVVVEMIHMFSYKVDFQRDLRPGDSFEVFYNYYYTPDGQPAKEGQISYAVMRLAGREIAL